MAGPLRVTEPGLVCHILNRRVMRLPLFQKDDDYLEAARARPKKPSKFFLTPFVSPCAVLFTDDHSVRIFAQAKARGSGECAVGLGSVLLLCEQLRHRTLQTRRGCWVFSCLVY